MMKRKPVLYDKKSKCCGCSLCLAMCPSNAIELVLDSEGFFYPEIDENKCVSCYLCEKVCAFKIDN